MCLLNNGILQIVNFFLEESESQRVHSILSDEPDGWGCLESRAHERSVGELGLRVRKVI